MLDYGTIPNKCKTMTDRPLIIGITGNIATGKSVIQRMLANAGALGIDADVIAHRMLYPDGPAYQPVIDAFGSQILTQNQEISNQKLGEIVFNDSNRLQQLESIVHPLTIDAIHRRVNATQCPIVVIEAIKLIESGLVDDCDQIWVSHAAINTQLQRLVKLRGMSEEQARVRINLQPPQAEKLSRADVIINTEGSFQETWEKTQKAVNDTINSLKKDGSRHIKKSHQGNLKTVTSFSTSQMEKHWQDLSKRSVSTLYEYLGMRRVFPITNNEKVLGFVIWNGWNFTATLEKVYPMTLLDGLSTIVFNAFEEHAQKAQSEIIIISRDLINGINSTLNSYGLSQCHSDELSFPAWKTAALKAAENEKTQVWLKVLMQPSL